MRKIFKWLGIVLGVLLLVVIVVVGIGYARGSAVIEREYEIEVKAIDIPDDPASIANGEYLANSLVACEGCHGADFSGKEMINEEGFLLLYSANLTPGEGGVGASFSDTDWLRALRHGVHANGRSVMVMPSQYLARLSGEDIGDIIAFLKTLPPVDHVVPEHQVFFMPRVLIGLGMIPPEDVAEIFPASGIDHDAPIPGMPEKGVTAEWGSYRALVCRACHGENLAGTQADPESGDVSPPNLTPGGELLAWTEAVFLQFMRTGVTPSGREVDPEQMPWEEFGRATDEDLRAIWLYLKSLEPLETFAPVEK